ncbi:nicotinate (nicotinamide) nucleotide adenylyltransferase [Moraxella nasovis]|uniref:nicotinate (nicotinamide) nucleotide adenylyltransferase n=1 Tax=Moraxella nasovis TaxID=2904121 RepID=UPI001F623A4D|nr:nicotinate (nicotinamide) nucleotide adenylyltransferase [Moraxella nasovis]UNU74007.1 nicotinate (nicotinamide) nucleotide adenylyltransferase [Moraxella nasovis]
MNQTIRAYLGGSFDPIHLGHLQMAATVFDTLKRHRPTCDIHVYLLPTAGNPFKSQPTSDKHRTAMLQLAAAGTPIGIDTFELSVPPPVFTIDTVKHLAHQHPNDRRIFIVGQDSLHALPTWKSGDKILDFVNIWAFHRSNLSEPLPPSLSPLITDSLSKFLDKSHQIYQDTTPIIATSSSQIRSMLANNNPKAEQFLSVNVANYIKNHALYVKL